MQQNAQALLLETIEELIRENEIDTAIDALLDLDKKTQAGISKEVTAVTANYRGAVKEYRIHQTISFEEFNRYAAKTRIGLLDLMGSIPRKIQLHAKLRGVDSYQFEVPDNVRLEKIIGSQNNLVTFDWIDKAREKAKSVCRVVCGRELGTGFISKDGYLFTNNHVIKDAAAAAITRIELNYITNPAGEIEQRTIYNLDPSDFISSPPDALDFARVKIIDNPETPLSKWGYLEVDTNAIPIIGDQAIIIQHPKGQQAQIAIRGNDVLSIWNQYVFYTTTTEPGSSGSPIMNQDWKVVALHHAGKTIEEGGMQINAKGDRAGANRGILFGHILNYIKEQGGSIASTTTNGHESFATDPIPPVEAPMASAPPTTKPVEATVVQHVPAPPPQPTHAPPVSSNVIPKLVILYDLQDETSATQLNKHLTVLKLTKKITVYNVQKVAGGEDVLAAAEREIRSADYILTLISSNIFNDEAIWLSKSLEALAEGKRVIPVLVDKADIEGTGLDKLRSLPSMNRAVSEFPNPEAAYSDIVEEIKRAIAK